MKTARWVRTHDGFLPKAIGATTGETVIVVAQSGRRTEFRLGRPHHFYPHVFYAAPPKTIDIIDGGLYERRLVVDGKEFHASKLCSCIWQGDTKSMKYRVEIGLGVTHDRYTIAVWSHEKSEWMRHVLTDDLTSACTVKRGYEWPLAAKILRTFWDKF